MNTTVITTLNVTGMTCGHCEKAVERAIKQLDPAAEVKADRTQNKVEIKSNQPLTALTAAIQEEAYTVTN